MKNKDASLQARLRARLDKVPHGRAITFTDVEGELRWRSFGDFYTAAAGRSAVLAEHGLSRGDTCVLVLQSDEFCAETILACLLMGALPVLVAPPVVGGLHSNLREVVRHVIRKTGARLVVTTEDEAALRQDMTVGSRGPRVLRGPKASAGGDPGAARLAFPSPRDIVALQLTSGTTGFPRVCVWEQKAMLATLDGMERAMALSADDVCVNWTPLYHDMGLINNFMLCLATGVPLAMLDTFDFVRRPALWLKTLAAAEGTVTWSPNFGYAITAQRARDADLAGVRLDHVKAFWNAAERIHLDTVLAFQRRFEPLGVRMSALKTNFGCAENIGGATFSDPSATFMVERIDRRSLFEKGVAVPATAGGEDDNAVSVVGVGRPFPGMKIRITGRNGQRLPDGHIGEITLDTPSRMRGYLRDARATKRALKNGALRTGDFGYLRGQELFWVGRVKERINIHGNKFDPSDFEPVLLKIDGLREGSFAAFGVDDSRTGTQRLVILAEVRAKNPRPYDEVLKEVREKVTREIGVSASDILLLKQGTMSKTSSGKRRHRFYKNLYLQGGVEPVARFTA